MAVIHLHPDKPPELYVDELGTASSHLRLGIGRRLMRNNNEAIHCSIQSSVTLIAFSAIARKLALFLLAINVTAIPSAGTRINIEAKPKSEPP